MLLDLAVFAGRLIGTMMDAGLWIIAIAVHFYFKEKGFFIKFLIISFIYVFIGYVLGAFSFPGDQIDDHINRVFYSVLASAAWLSIVTGVARLFRKSPSVTDA